MQVPSLAQLTRRVAGTVWLAAWVVVLWAVVSPWSDLGGLVDERLRWLEWLALFTAVPVGFTVGVFARDAALRGPGRSHLGILRWLLYPVGATTACTLVVLSATGHLDAIGVAVTAFLAYWAGLDLAFGAVPLMHGRPYRLWRPLEPDADDDDGVSIDRWAPPWERF